MPADGDAPPAFPPGEIGARFNQVRDLRAGEFVYVRMQVFRDAPTDFDSFQCRLLRPAASSSFAQAWSVILVPRSQIVCREPRAMIADGGVVLALDDDR